MVIRLEFPENRTKLKVSQVSPFLRKPKKPLIIFYIEVKAYKEMF